MRQKREKQSLAMDRIEYLFETIKGTDECSQRIRVRLIENIGKRVDLRLPQNIKRSYCKQCKTPYNEDTRIRIRRGVVTVTCNVCGDIRRFRYRH
ncbi:MAG: ribonuclease P [Candidatus Thermoplasmatota archaeon]|nr:ribonuclease P [Candidatus Thermoplasmatota archaeon]MCL5790469.1 ribonuclease P [Candidatus Thermoplasmatota archaeon]